MSLVTLRTLTTTVVMRASPALGRSVSKFVKKWQKKKDMSLVTLRPFTTVALVVQCDWSAQ